MNDDLLVRLEAQNKAIQKMEVENLTLRAEVSDLRQKETQWKLEKFQTEQMVQTSISAIDAQKQQLEVEVVRLRDLLRASGIDAG